MRKLVVMGKVKVFRLRKYTNFCSEKLTIVPCMVMKLCLNLIVFKLLRHGNFKKI